MSKEYGIDPGAINSFDSFFRIVPHFRPEHFRFIRKYPKKWPTLVKKAINAEKPIAKAKIIEKLKILEKELLDCPIGVNGIPPFDGNISWFENAKVYHSYNPFGGIINMSTAESLDYTCTSEDFDVDSELFDITSCLRVPRKAKDMAIAAKQILQSAKEIHFVDPHLEKMNQRHIKPLIEFLSVIGERINSFPSKVVYHIGNITDPNFVISSLQNFVQPFLPQGLTLSIIRWPTDLMHNRFILTEIGGISFGVGLDDDDNDPNQKLIDDISPLSREACLVKDCSGTKFMNNNQPIFYSLTGR